MKRNATIPIVLLMLLVSVIVFLNQRDLLTMSLNNRKTEFFSDVDRAMTKALKEIDYKLFDQCVIHTKDHAFQEEMLRDFENLKMSRNDDTLTSNHFDDLEEIDRYESLMLKYLAESDASFDYQSLGFHFVDSIVKVCFSQLAITPPYELGLYCPLESRFIFISDEKYESNLLNEGLRFEMFSPRQGMMPYFDQMIVFFPDLNSWLSKQNVSVYLFIVISCVLLLLCFFVTYLIWKRQREFTELKTNLINNMTHELKTPISTISLACEALQDDNFEKNPELVNTYIRIIKEENDKNKDLVENVLDIVRSAEQMHAQMTDMHVNEALKAIVSMYELAARKKNANIVLQLNAKNDLILADKVHVSNALSNIVDNALKYTPHDPEIVISTRNNTKGNVVISIKDNGIGISRADQKKIFDEFYRVGTGNLHDVKGHGLGLNYVKKVVDFHHGKISVESRPSEGSTFILSFPLKNIKNNVANEEK